jgi:hypothetical protein
VETIIQLAYQFVNSAISKKKKMILILMPGWTLHVISNYDVDRKRLWFKIEITNGLIVRRVVYDINLEEIIL